MTRLAVLAILPVLLTACDDRKDRVPSERMSVQNAAADPVTPAPAAEAPIRASITSRTPVSDPRPTPAAAAEVVPPGGLANSSWAVTAINGDRTDGSGRYALRFDQYEPGGLSGSFGCNSLQGRYALNGDHFSARDVRATEMACGEPAQSFERRGMAILASNMRIEPVDGRAMRLVSEAGSIDLKPAQ
ncbi:MAG: META domain-containing protein [Sphingomicrobium sp.]